MQRFGVAIDWETSGYTVPKYSAQHQGIAVAVVIFDIDTFAIVDSVYLEIKFNPKYQWDMGAEKIHGLTREYLAANGITQEEAAVIVAELIMKYNGTEKLIILGHRPNFDIDFTDQLMESVNFELKYDPVKIDSAAFATVFLGVNRSDEMFDMMGLPPRKEHNALEDIIYTLDTIRMMKELFMRGLQASA